MNLWRRLGLGQPSQGRQALSVNHTVNTTNPQPLAKTRALWSPCCKWPGRTQLLGGPWPWSTKGATPNTSPILSWPTISDTYLPPRTSQNWRKIGVVSPRNGKGLEGPKTYKRGQPSIRLGLNEHHQGVSGQRGDRDLTGKSVCGVSGVSGVCFTSIYIFVLRLFTRCKKVTPQTPQTPQVELTSVRPSNAHHCQPA